MPLIADCASCVRACVCGKMSAKETPSPLCGISRTKLYGGADESEFTDTIGKDQVESGSNLSPVHFCIGPRKCAKPQPCTYACVCVCVCVCVCAQ